MTSPDPPKSEEKTLYDKAIHRLKNKSLVVVLIFVFSGLVCLATLTDSIAKIKHFFSPEARQKAPEPLDNFGPLSKPALGIQEPKNPKSPADHSSPSSSSTEAQTTQEDLTAKRADILRVVELFKTKDYLVQCFIPNRLKHDDKFRAAWNELTMPSGVRDARTEKREAELNDAIYEFGLSNAILVIEREVPHTDIKEMIELWSSPEGQRIWGGFSKVMPKLFLDNDSIEHEAVAIVGRIKGNRADAPEVVHWMTLNVPRYMKDWLDASGFTDGIDVGMETQLQAEALLGMDDTLKLGATVLRNLLIKDFVRLWETEFSLDEIKEQIEFFRSHPKLKATREQMYRAVRIGVLAGIENDPIAAEKLRRKIDSISNK